MSANFRRWTPEEIALREAAAVLPVRPVPVEMTPAAGAWRCRVGDFAATVTTNVVGWMLTRAVVLGAAESEDGRLLGAMIAARRAGEPLSMTLDVRCHCEAVDGPACALCTLEPYYRERQREARARDAEVRL